jgi:hypothetical protein
VDVVINGIFEQLTALMKAKVLAEGRLARRSKR